MVAMEIRTANCRKTRQKCHCSSQRALYRCTSQTCRTNIYGGEGAGLYLWRRQLSLRQAGCW